MAHQDDAGLLSVKHSVMPAGGLLRHALRGVQWVLIALEETSEPQDRPLESRPSWWIRKRASFLGVTHGSRALEATSKQPRRVRECTSPGVRKETAVLRDGAVEIRFENGLRFLSGRCRPDSTLRGQPLSRYAVCKNHACRGAGRSAAFSLGGM